MYKNKVCGHGTGVVLEKCFIIKSHIFVMGVRVFDKYAFHPKKTMCTLFVNHK